MATTNITRMLFLFTYCGIFPTAIAFTISHKSPFTANAAIRAEHLRFQSLPCAPKYHSHNHAPASVRKTALGMSNLDHPNDDAETSRQAGSGTAVAHAGIPKIASIHNRDDLLEFLAEDDRLCVVKIYASWCKSCHKFGLKFKQYAQRHADLTDNNGKPIQRGQVRFAEIEYGANRMLCKSFGIKKLPYVQLYKMTPESAKLASASTSDESDLFIPGQIDGFVCGPAKFDRLVAERVDGMLETDIVSDDELSFQMNMEDGQALADELMEQTSSAFMIETGFSNGKNITARAM